MIYSGMYLQGILAGHETVVLILIIASMFIAWMRLKYPLKLRRDIPCPVCGSREVMTEGYSGKTKECRMYCRDCETELHFTPEALDEYIKQLRKGSDGTGNN